MSVKWYYSVGGKVSGALSWDELCAAARSGQFGPDDYVWTHSFGSEWHKASTLGTLFGAAEHETKEAMPEQIAAENAEKLEKSLPYSEEACAHGGGTSALRGTPSGVFAALKFALAETSRLLFSGRTVRRWMLFVVCALLVSNAAVPMPWAFLSPDMLNRLGLEKVVSSGIFKKISDFVPAVYSGQMDTEAIREYTTVGPELWDAIGSSCRETCVEIVSWADVPGNIIKLLTALVFLFFMTLVVLWFSAQGQMMMIARVFRPDDFLAVSWALAARPAKYLFAVLTFIRIAFFSLNVSFFVLWVKHMASIPPDDAVMLGGVCFRFFTAVFVSGVVENLLSSYIRNFSAVRLLLAAPGTKVARELFKGFGLWYFVYLFWYAFLWFVCVLSVSLLASLTGSAFPYLVFGVFFMPFVGLILSLPFKVAALVWRIELMFIADKSLRECRCGTTYGPTLR